LGVPGEAPLCIHVGRFAAPKNHSRLLSVFGELLRLEPEARLLLVGGGDIEAERSIRETVARCGLSKRVLFAGHVRDVATYLLSADLMIFPSRHEGAPGALLEAAAIGLPTLASELPGTREFAETFSTIRLLSLDASDADWATRARKMLCAPVRLPLEVALTRFEATPYAIASCARMHCEVWGRAGETAEQACRPVDQFARG
jgi:glycosyltransferase involved in cell wall biosynthesis